MTARPSFFEEKPRPGELFAATAKVAEITDKIPSLEKIIVVPYTEENPYLSSMPKAILYHDFCRHDAEAIEFAQLPFEHPRYIRYSSGTTGLPKCMVQSAGGVLLHQMKELLLHTDLKREDTIFYFTTCGWMMWNWLTTSLAVGATLVRYDGNPFHPGRLLRDARLYEIGAGTSEIRRMLISRALFRDTEE